MAFRLVIIAAASVIWMPCVHWLFRSHPATFASTKGLPLQARELAARQLELWRDPVLKQREIGRMRSSNAEWDFMGRSFLVWSLGEMAFRDPAQRNQYVRVMDEIILETLRLENEQGPYFFLMRYARARPYVAQPMRSLFLDSEIALMLATRRLVEERADYQPLLRARVEAMIGQMRRSPLLMAESYPDECWLFDHAVALAAIRLADVLDGTDHMAFLREWIANARQHLIDPKTGLLIYSFSTRGVPRQGPEGSSIWMAAHCLRVIDEAFAQDQYARAKKELGVSSLGFGWSREWPRSWPGSADIDSGVVIPLLDISAGGSGLALVGASSFGDHEFLSELNTTLDFAAFPERTAGGLKYCASNQVGDAVMLYSCVLGPIWEKVKGLP